MGQIKIQRGAGSSDKELSPKNSLVIRESSDPTLQESTLQDELSLTPETVLAEELEKINNSLQEGLADIREETIAEAQKSKEESIIKIEEIKEETLIEAQERALDLTGSFKGKFEGDGSKIKNLRWENIVGKKNRPGAGGAIFPITLITASFAISSSFAETASFALNAGAGGGASASNTGAFSGEFTGAFTGSFTRSNYDFLLSDPNLQLTTGLPLGAESWSALFGGKSVSLVVADTLDPDAIFRVFKIGGYPSRVDTGSVKPVALVLGNSIQAADPINDAHNLVLGGGDPGMLAVNQISWYTAGVGTGNVSGGIIQMVLDWSGSLHAAEDDKIASWFGATGIVPLRRRWRGGFFGSWGVEIAGPLWVGGTGSFGGGVTASAFSGSGEQIVGVVSSTFAETASFALNSSGALRTGSFTGTFIGEHTGNLLGDVVGDIVGTASRADTASFLLGFIESASFANTASHAINAATASFLTGLIESASFAETASFLLGSIESASVAVLADSASWYIGTELRVVSGPQFDGDTIVKITTQSIEMAANPLASTRRYVATFNDAAGTFQWKRTDATGSLQFSPEIAGGGIGISNTTDAGDFTLLSPIGQLWFIATEAGFNGIYNWGLRKSDDLALGGKYNFHFGSGSQKAGSFWKITDGVVDLYNIDGFGNVTASSYGQPTSSEPGNPQEGKSVQWVSDGIGFGNAGDLVIKVNITGSIKSGTLFDYGAA